MDPRCEEGGVRPEGLLRGDLARLGLIGVTVFEALQASESVSKSESSAAGLKQHREIPKAFKPSRESARKHGPPPRIAYRGSASSGDRRLLGRGRHRRASCCCGALVVCRWSPGCRRRGSPVGGRNAGKGHDHTVGGLGGHGLTGTKRGHGAVRSSPTGRGDRSCRAARPSPADTRLRRLLGGGGGRTGWALCLLSGESVVPPTKRKRPPRATAGNKLKGAKKDTADSNLAEVPPVSQKDSGTRRTKTDILEQEVAGARGEPRVAGGHPTTATMLPELPQAGHPAMTVSCGPAPGASGQGLQVGQLHGVNKGTSESGHGRQGL
ncbi:hypothetical protein NDU88_004355 [Pleurodeles waltl]|uniref:Uncharacterized protein n=1 Tax=Pleurodeles waltl TaxID=8319 RepID=A0AAV7QEM4_PLEWA|nr:hypothetical protein NDU88_004355 [Pleurodeles waltl]